MRIDFPLAQLLSLAVHPCAFSLRHGNVRRLPSPVGRNDEEK
jgi:hypothetical protein